MTCKKRYTYRVRHEGVDELFTIVDTMTNRDIAHAFTINVDAEWTRRNKADIRLIVAALNAYPPARRRRTRP